FSNVPGTEGKSVGQVNPDLLQAVSRSMSPYISDLAGIDRADVRGFDAQWWGDPLDNVSFRGGVQVFAVMNTDEVSGVMFDRDVMAQVLACEGQYAQDPYRSVAGDLLTEQGRLMAMFGRGVLKVVRDEHDDPEVAVQAASGRSAAAFDALRGMGSEQIRQLPGGRFITPMLAVVGAEGKDYFPSFDIAPDSYRPNSPKKAVLERPNYDYIYYTFLAASPELPAWFAQDENLGWAFDSGKLRSWEEIKNLTNGQDASNAVFLTMFGYLGDPRNVGLLYDAYDGVAFNND
ncbi:MAG: hypothetical protein ACRCSF_08800, partial [Mycobacteriaceae bacterium]